jgi:Ser/Thr protein kinase RdoA (MazF antagonist)
VTEFRGHVNTVYLVDDRIARPMGPWSPAVHALLRHLEHRGYPFSPRFLGIGEHRDEPVEWLGWIDGAEIGAEAYSLESLNAVGAAIRSLHDASAGLELPGTDRWNLPPVTGVPGEIVICHNDLAPRNTICRDGFPVAFIDWDLAGPAPRIWDIVHAIWQYTPLVHGTPPDIARIRALLYGYAMPEIVPARLSEVIARRMDQSASGIDALAD